MSNVHGQLGNRIRKLREDIRLTQADLAAAADISLKHLGELERGRGNPSLNSLDQIASVLEISLADLFSFSEEEQSDHDLREEITLRLRNASPEALPLLAKALKP